MDLRNLYQELILDHSKHPRNFGEIEEATCHANGHNPLCGDKVKVYLTVEGNRITDISFSGAGCAISTASASLMGEAIKGRSLEEVESLKSSFLEMLTSNTESEPVDLGKLRVLEGVKEFPMRVKCATLAWHTLAAALTQRDGTVTSE